MAAWLDGSTPGEADIEALLECQRAKGVVAFNIIPDRNWNFSDADTARVKIAKFREAVEVANRMGLPVNVGTELNKFGQPWIDNFSGGPMPDLAPTFLRGAAIMVGHTWLSRFANFSYVSSAANNAYADVNDKNAFFESVGVLVAPQRSVLDELKAGTADSNFARLADAAKTGSW